MQRLLNSAKFWMAVLDALVATISLVATGLLAPDKVTLVMTAVGIWQPVVIAVIAAICVEDTAAKARGTFMAPK